MRRRPHRALIGRLLNTFSCSSYNYQANFPTQTFFQGQEATLTFFLFSPSHTAELPSFSALLNSSCTLQRLSRRLSAAAAVFVEQLLDS